MKLFLTSTAYPPSTGGAQLYAHTLARTLNERHSVQVASMWDTNRTDWLLGTTINAPSKSRDYTIDHITVHQIGLSLSDKARILPHLLYYYLLMGKAIPPIASCMENYLVSAAKNSDVVHNIRIGREPFSYASLNTARKIGVPFFLTPVHHPRWTGWRYKSYIRLYLSADGILALTRAEKKILIELGVREERIFVTGMGPIVAQGADPVRFTQKHSIDGPMVLFLGQHYPYKGYRQVLHAAKSVWQKVPEAHLVFIGPPVRNSEDEFMAFKDRRIHYLGKVDLQEKTNALAACYLLCVPSTQESFGGVYTEAWTFAKPVIGCKVPAVSEVIADGTDGFLVDQVTNEIAEKICYLLMHPAEAREMGKRGQKKVQEQYTWQRIAELTEQGYQKVLTPNVAVAVKAAPISLSPMRTMATATSRPLRFIQVFNRYLMPGGEENSVARIADHLELAGHEVTRFWRASSEWEGRDAPPRWRQLLYTWNNPAVLDQLREVHEKVRPDAWIFHNIVPLISLGAYSLAKELGVPVIQWLHNYRPVSPSGTLRADNRTLDSGDPFLVWKEIWSGSWRNRFLTAWLALGYARTKRRGDLDAVKAWIALSEDTKRIFERAGFPSDKIHVLQHSWNIQPPVSAGSGGDYFLFLGRMVEEKGVKFLIELWQRPELRDVPLVMAGQGPLADFYRNRTPPNVRWAGFVRGKEKHRLVAGCRAVLFPSLWLEPFGLVAYEAYEQGRPLLASNIGGLKDLIVDGTTGYLLGPGNEAAWTEAILRFVRDPELGRTMGAQGLRWLNDHVSPAAWNRKFDEIVGKVIK